MSIFPRLLRLSKDQAKTNLLRPSMIPTARRQHGTIAMAAIRINTAQARFAFSGFIPQYSSLASAQAIIQLASFGTHSMSLFFPATTYNPPK